MRSLALLYLADFLRRFPRLRRLQNRLLAASWNIQRKCGRGPWEVE